MERSRSRLSTALEASGSTSTIECLRPDIPTSHHHHSSHHHVSDEERLAHTSSIAALRSISSAHGGRPLKDPRILEHRELRKLRLRDMGERQASRDNLLKQHIDSTDERFAQIDDARALAKAKYHKRVGERQLVFLTRGMKNGKTPVLLERAPNPHWVPAPPHMSSHWATITGHLDDPPPRGTSGVVKAYGRKTFLERPPDRIPSRPNAPIWGGSS